jgi:hypothetical protein
MVNFKVFDFRPLFNRIMLWFCSKKYGFAGHFINTPVPPTSTLPGLFGRTCLSQRLQSLPVLKCGTCQPRPWDWCPLLVITGGATGPGQWPSASAWFFNLHMAVVNFKVQNQRIRRIKFRTFHCWPLIKDITKNRLLPGLAADFFPETGHLLIRVLVWLPVLDAKSTKTPKPFIWERLRYGIWFHS